MPSGPHIVPADQLPRWSRYSAMLRDVGHDGHTRGDGVLTRPELESYIDKLYTERNRLLAAHSDTRPVDTRLKDSERMLEDMRQGGYDGLSYLPDEVSGPDFPRDLVPRVVEVLYKDDEEKTGRLTQGVIDRARQRYMALEGRSMPELNSRQRGLEDLDRLARYLGLH